MSGLTDLQTAVTDQTTEITALKAAVADVQPGSVGDSDAVVASAAQQVVTNTNDVRAAVATLTAAFPPVPGA